MAEMGGTSVIDTVAKMGGAHCGKNGWSSPRPKWVEQEWCPLEQVNPYQNEAENIIGCPGKPTSKKPPSLTHCASPRWGVPPGFCRNLSKRTNFLTSTNLMWGRHKSGVEASTNLAVHTNLLLVCINHPCFQKHPNRRQLAPNKHDNLLVSKTTVDLVDLMNKEHE